MKLKANFYSDWVAILKDYLSNEWGYDISSIPDDEIPFVYFNIEHRLVENRPRKIHYSDHFSCPTELERGWEILKNKIESGQDIKPHLSKLVLKATNKDFLLNDWRIHHFHLGEELEGDFIKRTGPLLFAIVTDIKFYVIDIFSHGKWADCDIVEIIHKNWPDLISNYRIRNVTGLSHKETSQDRLNLRKNHVNSFFECSDGSIYAPIGGGSVLSGYSIENTLFKVDQTIRELEHLQDFLENELSNLRSEIEGCGYEGEESLEAKLLITANCYKALFPKYNFAAILKKRA